MTRKSPLFVLFIGIMFICITALAGLAEARRGGGLGGGRSFSRGSAASGGGFSSRSSRQRPAPSMDRQGQRQDRAESRQDYREESREDWQQHRNQNREDWQDFAEDEWDDHYHRHYHTGAAFVAGVAVGAAASPDYVTVLPCSIAPVIINGIHYYQCGTTWYTRGNQGGTVVYIVSDAPAGH